MAVALVQENTALSAGNSTTQTVTLTSTATAGNILISSVGINKDGGTVTAPSGWTTATVVKASTSVTMAVSYKVAVGGEQVITWSNTTSDDGAVWCGEYSGLSGSAPDVSVVTANSGASSVTSQSTGTTATTSQADTFAIASWAADTAGNVQSGRAYTNSFSEKFFLQNDVGLIIADRTLTSAGTVESTYSTTDAGDQMTGAMMVWAIEGVTAALTGTMTATVDEDGITLGGLTIIVTIAGDTWKTAGTGPIGSTADTQALIDGFDAASSPTNGWNNEVRDKALTSEIVRTSATVATWTVAAQAGYDISAQEVITGTIPTAALTTGAGALTATPTFTIDVVAAGGRIMGSLANNGGLAGMGGLAGNGGGLAG